MDLSASRRAGLKSESYPGKLTPYQEVERKLRHAMEEELSELRSDNKSRHSQLAIKACEDYGAAWRVDMKHYCKHGDHRKQNIVRINERGNLCEDLPFLALTCRQVLGEIWIWYFSDPDDEDSSTNEETETSEELSEEGLTTI